MATATPPDSGRTTSATTDPIVTRQEREFWLAPAGRSICELVMQHFACDIHPVRDAEFRRIANADPTLMADADRLGLNPNAADLPAEFHRVASELAWIDMPDKLPDRWEDLDFASAHMNAEPSPDYYRRVVAEENPEPEPGQLRGEGYIRLAEAWRTAAINALARQRRGWSADWLSGLCRSRLNHEFQLERYYTDWDTLPPGGLDRTASLDALWDIASDVAGNKGWQRCQRPTRKIGLGWTAARAEVERLMDWCADPMLKPASFESAGDFDRVLGVVPPPPPAVQPDASAANLPPRSKPKGTPQSEVEVMVREYLLKHARTAPGKITRDGIAEALDVSGSSVSKTSAWKAFKEKRDSLRKPPVERTVPLTDKMIAILPDGSNASDELAAEIEKQEQELAAELGYPKHRRRGRRDED